MKVEDWRGAATTKEEIKLCVDEAHKLAMSSDIVADSTAVMMLALYLHKLLLDNQYSFEKEDRQ